MDKAFHDAMAAGYALTEPGLVIGSPMLDGELANDARVQVALSMLNRHGLIAGATGHGQDQDPPAPGRPAVEGGRAGLRGRHQGRPDRPRGAGRRDQPQGHRAGGVARLDVRGVGPPGRVPVAVGQARRPGPGDGPLVRAAAARQGPRPQRDADVDPRADLQVLRRQRPAAARPQGPRGDAQVPVVRRGQADPGRLRRDVERVGRRAPALDRRPRAGGRRRLLRRARVRGRGPAPDDARGRGDHQHPRAVATSWTSPGCSRRSCSGCSPSCTSRCPRRATCPSRSCASSSTRRTCCSTTRRRR